MAHTRDRKTNAMLAAQNAVRISDHASMFSKLALESALAELEGCEWDQTEWIYLDDYPDTLLANDLFSHMALVRHLAGTKCDTTACIAGHTVLAAIRHDPTAVESFADSTHVAFVAMNLLGLDTVEYGSVLYSGAEEVEMGPWMFQSVETDAIAAMFQHAATYGEWPLLSEDAVLRQLNSN